MKLIPDMHVGHWTVLSRVPKTSPIHWLCRCDCGVTKSVRGAHIISGASRSCGCQRDAKHSKLMSIAFGRT